jgi:hypothetical protein
MVLGNDEKFIAADGVSLSFQATSSEGDVAPRDAEPKWNTIRGAVPLAIVNRPYRALSSGKMKPNLSKHRLPKGTLRPEIPNHKGIQFEGLYPSL